MQSTLSKTHEMKLWKSVSILVLQILQEDQRFFRALVCPVNYKGSQFIAGNMTFYEIFAFIPLSCQLKEREHCTACLFFCYSLSFNYTSSCMTLSNSTPVIWDNGTCFSVSSLLGLLNVLSSKFSKSFISLPMCSYYRLLKDPMIACQRPSAAQQTLQTPSRGNSFQIHVTSFFQTFKVLPTGFLWSIPLYNNHSTLRTSKISTCH